jgi:hypothetical protein
MLKFTAFLSKKEILQVKTYYLFSGIRSIHTDKNHPYSMFVEGVIQ